MGWKGTNVVLKDLETKVMGFQVGFWGHTVMVGLGLGWKGTNAMLKIWGPKLWGFRWGFGVWGF